MMVVVVVYAQTRKHQAEDKTMCKSIAMKSDALIPGRITSVSAFGAPGNSSQRKGIRLSVTKSLSWQWKPKC